VNLNTAAEFLEAGAAALGIGGELVHPDHLKSGITESIVQNARKFLAIVAQTRAKLAATPVPAARSL
jgi:2-dehydro-3-deoxyphosphogluconate aldolase/(4S)-4-hydroxy-2-oxoglutarate aldolase